MKNLIVISKNEFDELKSLIEDLQCFLESLEPKMPSEKRPFLKHSELPTSDELNQIF